MNVRAGAHQRDLLGRFPKQRSILPERYKAIYVEHYRMNRSGNSLASSAAQKMESWMHRKVAEDLPSRKQNYKTLEVGAGNLNHLKYELTSRDYDIVEPFSELYEDSPYRSHISAVYRDVHEIQHVAYDRIVSIAAFEHLCDLPSVVAKCGLLLAPNGCLRVSIPSEGKLLWNLAWHFTTGFEFRLRYGLDYGVLMRHEHVNTADEIAAVLGVFFDSVRRSVFGLSDQLSLYRFFECTVPDMQKCIDYLERDRTT